VLDVPAKLAVRARVFDTGQGRKTDATDAHAIAMVALRDKRLQEVTADPELTVLRMLCDRRDELSRAHGHRHFGSAASRTRRSDATATPQDTQGHGPAAAQPRRRARGVNVERPAGRPTLTPTSAAAPSTAPRPCPWQIAS
jgi:hypothetical protein